jgi:hypothetical protein
MKPVFVKLPHDQWPERIRKLDGVELCYAVYFTRIGGTQRHRVRWCRKNPGNLAGWVFRAKKEDWGAWPLGSHTEISAAGETMRLAAALTLHHPLPERREGRLQQQLVDAILDMAKEFAETMGRAENWRNYLTPGAEKALTAAGVFNGQGTRKHGSS